MDKTNFFNLLMVIAIGILSAVSLGDVTIDLVPDWGIPLVSIIAIAVNVLSRELLKEEAKINLRISSGKRM